MKNNQDKISVKVGEDTVTIHATVTWQVVRSRMSPMWVAVCNELGLATEDKSLDELYASVMETMDLLFRDLVKEGDLDEFLNERGWRYSGDVSVPEPRFFIPWQIMMAAGQNDSIPAAA